MRLLDLFCGRWGWSKAFAARGWECWGVDLVSSPLPAANARFSCLDVLEIDDVRRFEPDFICASSPCEQFSVHGMKHFHPNPPYPELGIKLFEHTRRICEASGVPWVMENVRAAQQFVGNAVHHCGPFYLWGTGVPPLTHRGITKGTHDVPGVPVNRSRPYYRMTGFGGWQHGSKTKNRREATASIATIPPELAACVADYAERILETKVTEQVGGSK